MELKPGDVVMLKSGGQAMTVAEVNADDGGRASGWAKKAICSARPCRSPCWKAIDVADDEDEEDDEDDEDDDDAKTARSPERTRSKVA